MSLPVSSPSSSRRQRQRSLFPVLNLRGGGTRGHPGGHGRGTGVGRRSGLGSARQGEFTASLHPPTSTMAPPLLIHTSAPPLFFALRSSSPLPSPQVRYSILRDQSGDWRFFTIDPLSGAVVTRATLDREQKATYLIEVQSQDGTESARQGQQGQPNTGTHFKST